MLAEVVALDEVIAAAEARKLALAARWADAHPDPSQTGAKTPKHGQAAVSWLTRETAPDELEFADDAFIPTMAWDAGAPFAAAMGTTTAAGERFIRDALLLRHRLPRIWAGVQAGRVPVWRARRIAETIIAQPRDVSDALDVEVAPIAGRVGVRRLDQILTAILIRLHPEEVEQDSLDALDKRFVRLDESSMNHTGVADMAIRGDWADLHNFDQTVTAVAAALKARALAEGDYVESLDVRRARAVGILADPHTAAALLDDNNQAPTSPRRAIDLVVHLTPSHLDPATLDPVTRAFVRGDRATLTAMVQTWCGNPGATVTIRPVLDLAAHRTSAAYEIPPLLRDQTDYLAAGHCTFPWCTRSATRCDHDHHIAHNQGGRTCSCNLHPLCRRHHRLKHEAAWQVTTIEPGVWHWASPHGQTYRRDPDGTTPLDKTPPPPRTRTTGCDYAPWETPPLNPATHRLMIRS
jgi:hypothetical protein